MKKTKTLKELIPDSAHRAKIKKAVGVTDDTEYLPHRKIVDWAPKLRLFLELYREEVDVHGCPHDIYSKMADHWLNIDDSTDPGISGGYTEQLTAWRSFLIDQNLV